MVDMFGFHSTGVWLLNECACSRQLEKTRKCVACEHSRLPSHPVAAIFNATKAIDESHCRQSLPASQTLQPASKLSYLGERSEPRENARPSGEAARGRRYREARFACPNRRACWQATDALNLLYRAWFRRVRGPATTQTTTEPSFVFFCPAGRMQINCMN